MYAFPRVKKNKIVVKPLDGMLVSMKLYQYVLMNAGIESEETNYLL